MKPFKTQVNIQPQSVATGAVQAQQTLANKLDDFAGMAANIRAEKVVAQATAAGTTAGIEQQQSGQKLQLQQESFIGSIRSKTFNNAAREGYVKSLDNDIIESFSTAAAENSNNLQGYNTAVEGLAKGFMNGADPSIRDGVALSIDSMIARQRPKIQAAQAQRVVDTANDEGRKNTAERGRLSQISAFEGDSEQAGINLAAAIDSVTNRTDLSETQKAKEIRNLQLDERESFNSGNINRAYDEGGANAAYDMLDEMDGNAPGGFTPDEWDSFIASEQKKINRRIARDNRGVKASSKVAKHEASVTRGLLFTNPSIPADPAGNSQDRKDINAYYDSVAPEWQGNEQDLVNQNVAFVENTGLVPKQMISNVNASMRSGTVEQVALMSDYLSRVQETSPASLKDIPEESRAIALQVTDAQRAGMDAEVALEIARKNAYGLTDSEKLTIQVRTQEVSKGLEGGLQSRVDVDTDDGGFDTGPLSNVPDVPPMMLADYRNSFGRFMNMTGGDDEQSQALAYESIKSVWGVTETGGPKRFSKYAPEVVYNVPNVGSDWVEEQFNEEMEGIGAEGAILAIDKTTARQEQPSYPVFVPNKDTGILEPLRDDNQQNVTWKPEFKATDEYKAVTDAPGERVANAKKQREINLNKRANVIRRGIQSRVLSMEFIPANERADFMKSDDGKKRIGIAINNMLSTERIDDVEAQEARNAFGI